MAGPEFMAEATNQGPGPEGQGPTTSPGSRVWRNIYGNTGDRAGGGPEGPRGPEPPDFFPEGLRGPENETNPERGRWLVEQIVDIRTSKSYEERYSGENARYLKRLYDSLQEYVDAVCRQRNERDPWDRYERGSDGKVTGIKEIAGSRVLLKQDENGIYSLEEEKPAGDEQPEVRSVTQDERDSLLSSLHNLLVAEDNPTTPADDRQEGQRQLSIYFGLAKEKGLLNGVDQVLTSIARDIKSWPVNQARELIARRIRDAEEAAKLTFDVKRLDPEVLNLYQVWNVYINWARQRFELMLQGQSQPEYRGWEFQLPKEKGESTYWEVGNYPKYYRITAETQEQLLRAKETFMSMITNGSLGKSPEVIYQHVDNFKEVFGQRGSELVAAGVTTDDFVREQRIELEAKLYVFGAAYSNDTYNPKQWKEFMTAMALHEGPARWVRLLRTGQGQIAVFTYMFDKDPLMEIFINPVGDRGELDIIAQHYLQDQVMQLAIERGMGVVFKDYNPVDPDNQTRFISGGIANKVREQELKDNLERIGIHMPDGVFRALYAGFDRGDAHLNNYRLLGENLSEDRLKRLPDSLQESINLGRVQDKLEQIRKEIKEGNKKLERRDQTAVDHLSKEDKETYKKAYDKVKANFDIAFQMQGASGEKVRRGRGFLYVDRNTYIQAYRAVEEKSTKIAWLLSELKKYEESKGKKGKQLTDFGQEIQDFYRGLTDEEKTKNAQGLYGIKRGLGLKDLKSIHIGWMLSEMREDRRLDTFSQDERDLYYGLGEFDQHGKFIFKDQATADQVKAGTLQRVIPTDREDYVDHLPVYLAEKFVQYAVTHTKVQYANFGAEDRQAAVDKARKDAIQQIKQFGFQAKLELPKINFNENGDVIEEVGGKTDVVDFQTAVKHIYSRYTTHTYWGYQGENRHMILRPELFDAAKRIRKGQSSPEDEDVLASQLLIIDPTLKRVKKFDTDEVQREITLFQAAVEESFLSHVDVNKDLFKKFLPEDGARGKMRSGYNMEDWGGMMRFTMGIRELSASQPARFTRRLGAEIATMPMYIDSMAAIWGQDGVMGAISMFADKIEDIGHQGIVGQFAITKFIDQMDYAVQLYNALIGFVQEGKHVEGLYMKPTNDNDALHAFIEDVAKIENHPKIQLEFLKSLRSTFGRLETVLKIMRPMYSDVRNAGGALDLRRVDIFDKNGKFNTAIETDDDILMSTGTSRHLESDFYDDFAKWLISEWPGGGGQIYPDELVWNKLLSKNRVVFKDPKTGATISSKTFKRWFFEKAGL